MNLFSSYDNYTYYAHYLLLLKLSWFFGAGMSRNALLRLQSLRPQPPISVDAEPPVSESFPFIPSTALLWISSLLSASASTGSNSQPQFLGKCCMCCIMCIVSIMYFILIIFLPVADFLLHTLDKVVCPFPGQVLRHASMPSRKWGYPGRLGDDGCSSGHVSLPFHCRFRLR